MFVNTFRLWIMLYMCHITNCVWWL